MTWLTMLAGVWTIASPWLFNFSDNGSALWNSVVIGIALVVIGAYEMTVGYGSTNYPATTR